MTEREMLLAAITSEPDDDTPRLVYADWLQENGESDRAEYIRIRCRLAHLKAGTPEAKRLQGRSVKLSDTLFSHLSRLPLRLYYHRGFISSVTAGLVDFRDHIAKLGDDAPAFEWAYYPDERDEEEFYGDNDADAGFRREIKAMGEIAKLPALRRCVSLELSTLGVYPGEKLLASPHFVNVRRVNVPGSEAGPALHKLAGRTFKNLRWLNASGSNSARGVAKLREFTGSSHLKNLEYLDFSSNRVYGDDLWNLTEGCKLAKLRYLSLAHDEFQDFDVSYLLCWWPVAHEIPALKELDLSYSFGNFMDLSKAVDEPEEGEEPSPPLICQLEKLWLCGNEIDDAGAKLIASFPQKLNLTLLDLRDNPIGPTGQRALRKRFGKGVCHFGKSKR
jgi:uncharacterized protein (TIGR02996 family)